MKLYTTEETAELLGVGVRTLHRWRAENRGPKTVKLEGFHIRYSEDAIQEWLEEQKRLNDEGPNHD